MSETRRMSLTFDIIRYIGAMSDEHTIRALRSTCSVLRNSIPDVPRPPPFSWRIYMEFTRHICEWCGKKKDRYEHYTQYGYNYIYIHTCDDCNRKLKSAEEYRPDFGDCPRVLIWSMILRGISSIELEHFAKSGHCRLYVHKIESIMRWPFRPKRSFSQLMRTYRRDWVSKYLRSFYDSQKPSDRKKARR